MKLGSRPSNSFSTERLVASEGHYQQARGEAGAGKGRANRKSLTLGTAGPERPSACAAEGGRADKAIYLNLQEEMVFGRTRWKSCQTENRELSRMYLARTFHRATPLYSSAFAAGI